MKIRIGIIGMGKMGMMHSAILNSIDAVEVTSICDNSRFFNYLVSKADFPGKVFSDYKELISSDDVDVVFITTPVFLHYPMIIECIEKGKHFFVEKPLCLNKKETDAISNKLQKTNLKSMIGYVYNFKPTYSKLKSIINNKELGDVVSFKSFSYKSSVKSRTNNWRFNRNLSGGGVVTSFGSHMLSIIFDIFGNPKETYIEKESYFNDDIEDFARISLVYNKGIKGEFLTDWSKGNYRKEDNRISIKCSNGEISA